LGLDNVAKKLKELNINGLLVIGGFEVSSTPYFTTLDDPIVLLLFFHCEYEVQSMQRFCDLCCTSNHFMFIVW